MTNTSQPGDFDNQPPVPVSEYKQTVRRVNVGYEFLFTLTGCLLRAQRQPNINLLVVGGGGGAEIELFLPENPGWQMTVVDPSHAMLALAHATVERLGVGQRVTLIQGGVESLPATARFDAATCLFVLHFLPDDGKLALLRETARRLHQGAPLIVAAGTRPDDAMLRLNDDFLGAWQQYGELMGMPAEQMAGIIQQLSTQMAQPGATTDDGYVRLLHDAGFTHAARFFSALGGMCAWIAR